MFSAISCRDTRKNLGFLCFFLSQQPQNREKQRSCVPHSVDPPKQVCMLATSYSVQTYKNSYFRKSTSSKKLLKEPRRHSQTEATEQEARAFDSPKKTLNRALNQKPNKLKQKKTQNQPKPKQKPKKLSLQMALSTEDQRGSGPFMAWSFLSSESFLRDRDRGRGVGQRFFTFLVAFSKMLFLLC